MAFVYKKRDFEDGDVPVPEMWNASMNAFSAEMNGLLDSLSYRRTSRAGSEFR